MSQDIILKRELKTETWLIQGEIASAGNRPEINCVLQFLSEHPNSKAADCAGHLFGDNVGRNVVAERLLNMARYFKLAELERGKYRLTDEGKKALEKNEILVPEEGCWAICVCEDPLLPHQLLSIDVHHEPTAASTGLNKNRENLKERANKLVKVPKNINAVLGLQVQPIAGGQEVRINKIEAKGEKLSHGKKFQIEWNVTGGTVEVKRSKELIFTEKVETVSRDKVLKLFMKCEGLADDWQDQSETLTVSFADTNPEERLSMKRTIKISKPVVSKLGSFAPLSLSNISITPRCATEAKEWALWRLKQKVNMYASANKYKSWTQKALEPFMEFDVSIKDRAELANELWFENSKKNDKCWHLMAAQDWNL